MTGLRCAVVGHAEWVDFLVVDRLPAQGEILHAREHFEGAGGGGSMAAYVLAELAGAAAFLCAVGDDQRGAATEAGLRAAGLDVHAAVKARPQRRTVTYLEAGGERTITVVGERLVPSGDDPLPWLELASCDAVYFTGGDGGALQAARAARVLVATPRARDALLATPVVLDALVGSASDGAEQVDEELLALAPRHVVNTAGSEGGTWRSADGTHGSWQAAPLPGTVVDSYGCGDAFAAGLTYGLAAGMGIADACALGAHCGAAVLCERAPSVGRIEP